MSYFRFLYVEFYRLPEGCALEDVGYPRVNVRLVPVVFVHLLTDEGREKLVHDQGLEEGTTSRHLRIMANKEAAAGAHKACMAINCVRACVQTCNVATTFLLAS